MTARAKSDLAGLHPEVWVVVLLLVAVLVVSSCRDMESSEEKSTEQQVLKWLERTPPLLNPPLPPPERYYYKSFEEWAQAGREIEGIEKVLLGFLTNNTTRISDELIVHSLGYVGGDESVSALLEVVQEGPETSSTLGATVSRALASLGQLRNPKAVAPLCELVKTSENSHFVTGVICVLGLIGDPRAKPVIEEMLEKKHFFNELERQDIEKMLQKLGEGGE